MPQDQVTLRVFSHRCWTVALIGQFVGVPSCLRQIYPLIRPATQQSEMLPLSRTSPRTAADSRVSPYPMGRANHKHRFCISLLNLHNGRTLGHSCHSVPFRPFLLHSIYVLLSIAFVHFPCSLFATLVPSSPTSQTPRSLHSTYIA